MEVLKVSIRTVEVKVLNSRNEESLIYIPITNDLYEENIDYTTYISNKPLITETLNKDFFDDPIKDIEKIIKTVSTFLRVDREKGYRSFIEKEV